MSDPAHVIATIDAAVEDRTASPDAMRWTPHAPPEDHEDAANHDREPAQPVGGIASDAAVEALRDALTNGPRWHFVPQAESRAAGLTHPVKLTRAAWQDCVAWDTEQDGPQDETGRLWDVLWMTSRFLRGSSSLIPLLRVPRGHGGWVEPEEVRLLAWIGPDHDGEPVITISTTVEEVR